ncbi:hypothetical protein QUF79_01580 [Fictibacillus enclensis]|uniref:alpha/beta fold hydrolase n=1 Tax=Fictibacillus enclensis TaxID=1017270 RepID=UPI0025A10BEA|nr:hypothetical protein [Fictibacillus enclensis]MDM5196775.1 hypothetical protein [Fictibacillus enclensis]
MKQGKYIDAGGINTHYHEDGSKDPLLLIHGLGPLEYSVDVWVNHMIAFIEKRGLEKLSIIGNFMAGALALHIANRRPYFLDKLI